MNVPREISSHNFKAFLWHAVFLALAQNFMDVDTIIPSMVVEAGGNALHIGIITAILLGGSSFTQILFAPFISNQPYKKVIILSGINGRIISLLALGSILFFLNRSYTNNILPFIFLFISIFSLGGAFANIGYMDIIGKAILAEKRRNFFSTRQIVSGFAVLASAYFTKLLISSHSYPMNYSYSFMIGAVSSW
jgi:hypothetical protein